MQEGDKFTHSNFIEQKTLLRGMLLVKVERSIRGKIILAILEWLYKK